MVQQNEGRVERCGRCKVVFAIHHRCDRGQQYCSDACRVPVRREVCRRARTRHAKSREGRLDHRDYMRAFRARKRRAKLFVTDLASQNLAQPSTVCVDVGATAVAVTVLDSDVHEFTNGHDHVNDCSGPQPDPSSDDVRPARDTTRDSEPSNIDASTRSVDAARRFVAVVPTSLERCIVCGRRVEFVRAGPLRRTRIRPALTALRGGHCRDGPHPKA